MTMTTKYYQRDKCYCHYDGHKGTIGYCPICEQTNRDWIRIPCKSCENKGFIRGADVTELMIGIKSIVTKQIWTLILGVLKDLIEVVEE